MKRLITLATLLSALVVPATAQAWTSNTFYSPSRNIECKYFPSNQSEPMIPCTTFNDGFVGAIGETDRRAQGYWRGGGYVWGFHRWASGPTLQYGQDFVAPGVRCHSASAGMRCWSRVTGYGFMLARTTFNRF